MNTWIAGKDLMKHHFLIKKIYSNLNMEDITTLVIGMQKEYLKILIRKILVIIIIYMSKVIHCYLLM